MEFGQRTIQASVSQCVTMVAEASHYGLAFSLYEALPLRRRQVDAPFKHGASNGPMAQDREEAQYCFVSPSSQTCCGSEVSTARIWQADAEVSLQSQTTQEQHFVRYFSDLDGLHPNQGKRMFTTVGGEAMFSLAAGCENVSRALIKVLSHVMSAWSCQLVHQS